MTVLERTAAAPISWGVCEVPDWGLQLPVDRVLSEMAELGFHSTELGSVGYLPTEVAALRATLARYDLELIGGFVALALHNPSQAGEARRAAIAAADLLAGVGATYFVTCAVNDPADWSRPELDDAAWQHLFDMIDEIETICADRGLRQAFHPHVDSLVQTAGEVERLRLGSRVRFVLDTGHLAIGGVDPLEFVHRHGDRVDLVHLKDLRSDLAARFNAGELRWMEAVQEGLFVPLGEGDAAIGSVVRALEEQGYDGWYVVEQDAAITSGEPPLGAGPIRDVRTSAAFIRSVDAQMAAETRQP